MRVKRLLLIIAIAAGAFIAGSVTNPIQGFTYHNVADERRGYPASDGYGVSIGSLSVVYDTVDGFYTINCPKDC